jgi:hypothetical protein
VLLQQDKYKQEAKELERKKKDAKLNRKEDEVEERYQQRKKDETHKKQSKINKGKDQIQDKNGEEMGSPGSKVKTQADEEIKMKNKADEEQSLLATQNKEEKEKVVESHDWGNPRGK